MPPQTISFTKQGDTVATLSAESDGVVECALHFGRRVETFVATEGVQDKVGGRVEEAWESAWRQGKFVVSMFFPSQFTGIVVVGCFERRSRTTSTTSLEKCARCFVVTVNTSPTSCVTDRVVL